MKESVDLLLRLSGKDACPGDSVVSWLHYRLTTLLLVFSSLTLCFYQHFGDPIECISYAYPENVYKEYCWVYGTVSVPDLSDADAVITRYAYYRWVWFVLMVQAGVLYVPRLCWKRWRRESIFELLRPSDDETKKVLQERANDLALYVEKQLRSLVWFLSARCLCSLAYLALVLMQMFLMDQLLNGAFLTYGIDILYRDEAMELLFPKVTACELQFFSESGAVEKDSTLCVLPLNIFNQKLFVGMWFWFFFLALCSVLKIVFLGIAMSARRFRVFLLRWRCGFLHDKPAILVAEKVSVPQWYRLFVLSAQVDVDVFQKVVVSLARKFGWKKEKK